MNPELRQKTVNLREKFKLAPSPQGVEKIAKLVDGRQTASLEEIAKIINSDVTVTGRLMQRAYPRAPAREGATIQMATSRVGVNYVIVLFIADMLTRCVTETFETMAGVTLVKADPAYVPPDQAGYLVASVRFKGKAAGKVSLAFSSDLSLVVASRLLGEDVEYTMETISDAVGELVNIVTGNLQSGLCDGRLTCEVELPEVSFQDRAPNEKIPGGYNEDFFFRHGNQCLRVHLCVNPFSSS